jgi:UDP:flavonoid glycosyltransferase YjiC (YdhE family)
MEPVTLSKSQRQHRSCDFPLQIELPGNIICTSNQDLKFDLAKISSLTMPKILICATPVYGHVMPLRAVGRELIARGYDVTFLTGSDYKQSIEDIGATFVSLTGESDLTEDRIESFHGLIRSEHPPSKDEINQRFAIDVLPSQHEGIQEGLKNILKKAPGAKIVVVFEGAFKGVLPGIFGAPGIRPTGYIGVGIIPVFLSSIDLKPIPGVGFFPDNSPEGQARNLELTREDRKRWAGSQQKFEEIMKEMGATVPDVFNVDVNYMCPDRFVQMCAPSIEFPRSDAPSGFRFAGGLPPGLRDPFVTFPEWWDDIAVNPEKKKVVFVSQGTMATDSRDLIIPTMHAFKDSKNVIVVAALGKKGLTLPEGTLVPENSRVSDWIPYDEMLQYSDVLVTNGGYGAVQHALSHGVPLIVAGIGADKPDNAMRVEWAEVGIDMKAHQPTPEAVRLAVTNIFEDPKYMKKARAVQAEMQSYDPVGVIIESIEEVAAGK